MNWECSRTKCRGEDWEQISTGNWRNITVIFFYTVTNKTRVIWQSMHVARSRQMGSAHKVWSENPKRNRTSGRPKHRVEDNI